MRSVARVIFLTLALILLGLALTPKASPAQSGPCDPAQHVAYWWYTSPVQPCAGENVSLVFGSCRDCVQLLDLSTLAVPVGGTSNQRVLGMDVRSQIVCPLTLVCRPDTLIASLGTLAAGKYQVLLDVHDEVVKGDSTLCTVVHHDTLTFTVGCTGPPPPGTLPYVRAVRIGPPPPCATCAPSICPNVPIPFHVEGVFPDNCERLVGVRLLPSMIVGPRAEPPIARLVVAVNDCLGMPCTQVLVPFAADTLLPGLPGGSYLLPLEVALVSACDTSKVDTVYRAAKVFSVLDSCAVPPQPVPCLAEGWDHSGRIGVCDAFVGPDSAAGETMTLRTPTPLAGLQGTLHLYPPGLRISALAPTGSAAGAHLSWEPTSDGAKFVMFADSGAPIGVADSAQRCILSLVGCPPVPVLHVEMIPVAGATPAPVTFLSASDLLGSDVNGKAVEQCRFPTLVAVQATICSGHACDFNHDGHLDVRDLVTMVHCILGTGPCPDTTRTDLDCDRDGTLNVDDVLCCARSILHGGDRDTTRGRPAPEVSVSLGAPVAEAAGVRVPVRITGADLIGAGRLALSLPLDRYEVTGVETGASSWLEVHETMDGELVLGLIGLGPAAEDPATLDLTLHLALKGGQGGGGEVALADGQFSGPDGVTLDVPVTTVTQPLPGGGPLALSIAQPNPFGHETRFTLNLDRATDVELTVHDLSGRRVATIYHGALGAGPHTFGWQGLRGDGTTAPNGVYFLHARVGGERLTRKVVFLPGN